MENNTPTVDVAARLKAKALDAKLKTEQRVSSEQIMLKVTEFLNSDKSHADVTLTYPVGKPLSQIEATFKRVIRSEHIDELVWPIKDADKVFLVKLV